MDRQEFDHILATVKDELSLKFFLSVDDINYIVARLNPGTLKHINLACTQLGLAEMNAWAPLLHHCKHLRSLKLYGNDIGDESIEVLTSCIKSIPSITEVDLSYNKLTATGAVTLISNIPPTLKYLDVLSNNIYKNEVVLSTNSLLPLKHSKLTTFSFGGNRLSKVGVIALLSVLPPSLTDLNLGGNCIDGINTALASCIKSLPHIRTISLAKSQISDTIVVELAACIQDIHSIDLDENNITNKGAAVLAEQFCGKGVRFLALRGNEIADVGAIALLKLRPQCTIYLSDKYIANTDLLDKFLESGVIAWKSAKLILIGNGKIGKTTLLRNMIEINTSIWKRFFLNKDEPESTVGIGQHSINIGGGSVTVFDFAGQLEYAVTHQFFLSSQMTTYLLCYDLSAELDEQLHQIFYWLKYLNALLASNSPYHLGSVILIGLKSDKCKNIRSSRELLRLDDWQCRFKHLFLHTTFQLSAHSDGSGLLSLFTELDDLFSSLFGFVTQMPYAYLQLLPTVLEHCNPIGSIGGILKVQYSVRISEEAVSRGLHFLHAIGKIILLPNGTIISDPSFIASIFAKFLSPESVRTRLLTRELGSHTALLSTAEIGLLLNTDNTKLREHVTLMCDLRICYEIPSNDTVKKQYLFPSLGKKVDLKFTQSTGVTDGFRFTAGSLSIFVPGLFCQLIVELCRHFCLNGRNLLKVGCNGVLAHIPANDGQLICQLSDDSKSIYLVQISNKNDIPDITNFFYSFIEYHFPQCIHQHVFTSRALIFQDKGYICAQICPTCLRDGITLSKIGVYQLVGTQTQYCESYFHPKIVAGNQVAIPELRNQPIPAEDLEGFVAYLGRGAQATVITTRWRGAGSGQLVAVKQIELTDQMTVKSVREEVDLMAQLRHECICSVIGICIVDTRNVWLVLENIKGGDLFRFLQEKTESLPRNHQINFCLQAARAVNFLHAQTPPVIHRDLKANNFLVADSRLKLADFGIATAKTVSIFSTGTLNWTAPEIFEQVAQWVEATDIYSLGMVFYEIIARQLPFHEDQYQSEEALKSAVIQGVRPAIPEDTIPELANLIRCCWDPIPNSRPTAMQLVEQLETLSEVHPL